MFAGMDSVRTISQCTACSNLHISLPGKEMDRVEVVSVRPSARPSVREQFPTRYNVGITRAASIHSHCRVGIGRDGMAWCTYEPSKLPPRPPLHLAGLRECETALAVTLASLFDNRTAPNGRCAIAKWQELVPTLHASERARATGRASGEKSCGKNTHLPLFRPLPHRKSTPFLVSRTMTF